MKLTLINTNTKTLKVVDSTSNGRSAWGPAGAPLTLKKLTTGTAGRIDIEVTLLVCPGLFQWIETILVSSCGEWRGAALRSKINSKCEVNNDLL